MPHIPGHKKERRRLTPEEEEERKKRIARTTELIGEREKKTRALMETGISEKTGRIQAKGEIREREEQEEESRRLKEAAPEVLEEAGAFEEVTPRERELAPVTPTPDIAVIGPALGGIAATTSSLEEGYMKGWVDKQLPGVIEEERAFAIPSHETIREAALREIREASFKEGITQSQSFGAYMETIPFGIVPFIGSDIDSFIKGLTDDPFSSAEEAVNHINKIKEAASTGQEKVRNNLEDPDYGLDRARDMEEQLAELSGRMKFYIEISAKLRADPEKVNTIQEQILEAEEKVSRYRNAATFGLTAQLTGTGRIVPTDEQMYFELKRLNE